MSPSIPWPAGTATGVGSLPGTDPLAAVRSVFDETPDLPYLPELPGRGAGADMIGRAAAIITELPMDLQPSGWRLVSRPGLDVRRARDLLERDLDALGDAAAGYTGPIKLALPGPWTLAGTVELTRGHKALSDPGAARDLAEALVDGARAHLADVVHRLPGARPVVQLDEPVLPAVLAGTVRTPSGFSTLPAVEEGVVTDRLALVGKGLTGAGAVAFGFHCCAGAVPLGVFRAAGADFAGFDVTLPAIARGGLDDPVGEAVEAGMGLILGAVPALPTPPSPGPSDQRKRSGGAELSDVNRTVSPIRAMWRRLGFAPGRLGEVVAVSPTCGLAGAPESYARAALRLARRAGQVLVEAPE